MQIYLNYKSAKSVNLREYFNFKDLNNHYFREDLLFYE